MDNLFPRQGTCKQDAERHHGDENRNVVKLFKVHKNKQLMCHSLQSFYIS